MFLRSGAAPRRRPLLPARAAFWVQASVLLVIMAASSAPSPLYPLYQDQWGFPPVVLTVIFAAYVVALLAALLTVGALSDHLGRRPVLLAALVLEIAAMAVFVAADSAGTLIAARLVQGLATGTATGALGAYVIELEPRDRRGLGTVLTGAGPVLGLAAGAVVSSLIVAAAPAMIDLVFLVLLGLLVLQAVGTALGPETVVRAPGALASLVPRVSFPPQVRPSALWVLPAATACWALGGLIISLGPNLVRTLTGAESVVLTGVVVAALTGTGGIAILFLGATAPRRVLALGMSLLAAGMAATIGALAAGSVVLYLAATVVAGVGFGAGFLGVLRTLLPQAAPHERAGLLSAVYVVSYLSHSIPAVAAGAVAGTAGLVPTAIGYAGAVLLLAVLVLAGLRRNRPAAGRGRAA
ncbi:MFS transporter [Kocuria flava]|uniref:MFS transporter n=1 Tax=Kocuria flava TaxID=446860 RepID=UPI001FF16D9C|nr:MFS transporter [Kocuria flava]MCJ8503503.1 MFS transporter [Kocuria flava]